MLNSFACYGFKRNKGLMQTPQADKICDFHIKKSQGFCNALVNAKLLLELKAI